MRNSGLPREDIFLTTKVWNADLCIAREAWRTFGRGEVLADLVIAEIAKRHARSLAQVILRWHLEMGNIVIPKSLTPSRMVENCAVDDFHLSADDIAAIKTLERPDGQTGADPMTADF